MTEKEFSNSLIATVQLSLATSKIAVDKASNKNVKEFAGFELAETTAITSVLKDLDTIIPEMTEEAKVSFAVFDSTSEGIEFDKLYMQRQLQSHRLLRDLTEDYLNGSPTDHLDKDELQGKHLATMALVVFKEHVIIIERISKELTGGGNE